MFLQAIASLPLENEKHQLEERSLSTWIKLAEIGGKVVKIGGKLAFTAGKVLLNAAKEFASEVVKMIKESKRNIHETAKRGDSKFRLQE